MGSRRNYTEYWNIICEILWALALIFLPLTSFPMLASITGGIVAPLSILPLIILLLICTLPLIFSKGELPKETIPLLLFVCVAVISTAAAFFIFIPGFKGKSVPAQDLRAIITLLVGVTFYIITTSWVRTSKRLENSWKYITIGGMAAIGWACIQSYFILKHYDFYPAWMTQVQSWLVVLSPQYSPKLGRVSGFTYEASWFAHQMVIVYLPIWISATYHKTSAFRWRIFSISIENILLVIGLGVFFLSSPRIGLISFFLMLLYLFFKINVLVFKKVSAFLSARLSKFFSGNPRYRTQLIRVFTGVLIICTYALVFAGTFFIAVQRDWRLGELVSQPPTTQEIVGVLTLDENTLLNLSHRFIFLERMVYWMNGWNIFSQYPWLGVGIGNSGFFFPSFAPAMGWATNEIRSILFYLNQLPNVKSLWFRLLAETGIIGFAVFISWIYVLFQSGRFSYHSQDPVIKTLAMAGLLSVLAFIGEGFSIDSFAMPYLWVMAGLIAAMAMIYRRELREYKLREVVTPTQEDS